MTKLSDYETIVRSTTKDHHKFFRRFYDDLQLSPGVVDKMGCQAEEPPSRAGSST